MKLPKAAVWILAAAHLNLLAALALQRFDGTFDGNWQMVLMSAVLIGVAFSWETIAKMARQ